MKIKTLIIVLVASTLLVNTSCKKESDKQPSCRITKLIYNGALEYDIKYGDNEKVSAIEIKPGTENSTYKYENGNTIITFTHNGNFDYRMIVNNNKNGFATNVKMEFDQAGTKWLNNAFSYDGNKVLVNDATDYNGGSESVNYIWKDGNIAMLVEENDIIEYEYYTDKPYQAGDWRYIQQLLSGYRIYENKNLLQSFTTNGNTTVYTYQFDDAGRIIEAKSTSTISTSTFKVEYECQ